MSSIIKQFADGSLLEYDRGLFDDWCIYLKRPDSQRYAPKDYEYFERMKIAGQKYGMKQIYDDFISIYNDTKNCIEQHVLNKISALALKYGHDSISIEIDFVIIYAGMVAEENKAFTKLGKRVKRLGLHQVLIESIHPNEAANYSRGKKWQDIDSECTNRGF